MLPCVNNEQLVFAPNLLRFDPSTVDPSDMQTQMKLLKDAGLAPNFVEHLIEDPPPPATAAAAVHMEESL